MDSLLIGEITYLNYCGFSSVAREARNGIIFFIYQGKKTVKYSKNIFQEWGKVEKFLDWEY